MTPGGSGTATELHEHGVPPAPPKGPARRILTWLSLAALVGSAIVGSNMFSVRDRLFGSAVSDPAPPAAGRDASASTPDTAPERTALRSQPWWQNLTTLEGTGTMTSSPFTVDGAALQWRVKWSCQAGRLLVRTPRQTRPVVDGACPEGAVGYGVQTGVTSVEVQAEGPWRLEVSQQIDAPLVEPPLPAMTAAGARTVGTGSFYRIDRTGTGKVTIYRQPDGRYAVRLDDFFVSPTADLELRLSTLEAPRTSEEFIAARSELVSMMDVTAGSLNYTVPAGVDPTKFKSVVIWCAPINSAYAAATIEAR